MRIGFTVDNPKRDLKGLIITSKHLIENGHDVVLFPMKYVSIDSVLSQLEIMIFNYIRPNNINLIKKLSSLGVKIYILDTEGGVISESGLDSPNNWAKSFKNLEYYKYVDGYFFWGERLFNAFKKHSGLEEEKLYLTGCPRYDQCHERWFSIQEPRHIDHVLINTNFSSINPKFSKSIEEEKLVMIDTGWEQAYVNNLFNDMSKTLVKFINEIKKIANTIPNQKFVVRPHPFENKKKYVDAFSNFKNIIIDDGGDIFDALLGAKCILHLNCGTSIDSYLSRVPPISIEYLNTSFLIKHTPLPSSTSYLVHSLNKLEEVISSPKTALSYLDNSDVYDQYIAPYFYSPDGKASDRIAFVLNKVKYRAKKNSILSLFFILIKDLNLIHKLYASFGFLFGTKLISIFREKIYHSQRDKKLDLENIKSIYKTIGIDSNLVKFSYLKLPKGIFRNSGILLSSIKNHES